MSVDMRGYKSTPVRRLRFTEWYYANAIALRTRCVACAALVGSQLEAGVVTAYTWPFDTPIPLQISSSPQAAEQWLQQQLDKSFRGDALH